MSYLQKGRYRVDIADSDADFAASYVLRTLCFGPAGGEQDVFDAASTHFLVTDTANEQLVCSFRVALLDAQAITASYSGQFYDLERLARFQGNILELGRFCVHPQVGDPDLLRIAWGALTRFVDEHNVRLLFGCSSFQGTDPAPYLDAFAHLKARHLAPPNWAPHMKSDSVFDFDTHVTHSVDAKGAMAAMPPLLRTYLMMGGWVSNHAVVDHHMNTLHVFTGLEIAAIPPARKRLLRAVLE